jgi:hypothetical protein
LSAARWVEVPESTNSHRCVGFWLVAGSPAGTAAGVFDDAAVMTWAAEVTADSADAVVLPSRVPQAGLPSGIFRSVDRISPEPTYSIEEDASTTSFDGLIISTM